MKKMDNYNKRLKLIKEILQTQTIESQSELIKALKKFGISTTQATIARDFKKLNVIKVRDKNKTYYKIQEQDDIALERQLSISFTNFVKRIDSVDNLVLIFTTPGNANGVASIIDKLQIEGIAGTIAGDDTILVITRKEYTQNIIEYFKKFL